MEKAYSTFDVMRILEIDRECLREWVKRGYIVPSIQQSSGRGTKALFSRTDLFRIAIFQKAVQSGLSRGLAYLFVKWFKDQSIRDAERNPETTRYIIFRSSDKDERGLDVSREGIRYVGRPEDKDINIFDILEKEDFDEAHVINIARIFKKVRARS